MIKKIYDYFMKDSLYRNSIYLMFSTFIMAFLGFFFWMINARLFNTEQVGLATTIISVMSLIASFSVLGLNTGLIRYLPRSKRKDHKINTCFTGVIITTIIVSSIFLLGLEVFSPKILFIKENVLYSFLFIFFMIIASSSLIIDSILIAFRNAKYVLLKNTIFSILKLILPFALVSLGAYGIFSSWMLALTIGFMIAFIVLIYKHNYRPRFVFHDKIIKKIGKYSFGNYIAGFLKRLPILFLPLMITNILDPEVTAYYYMAMMIGALLFMIPEATSESLFVEGSYNKKKLKYQIKKVIKIILLLLIPGILITIFLGNYILLLFGNNYSLEGYRFLQLLAFSGIFVSINYVCETILRVKYKIKQIIITEMVGVIIILGLSYLLITKGLLGIGLSWIIGQAILSLIYLGLIRK